MPKKETKQITLSKSTAAPLDAGSQIGTLAREFRMVPVDKVEPTPDNPRTLNVKAQLFIDFAATVKRQGVVVPVHVRDHPTKTGHYELRAGERRWTAAKVSGLREIPAIYYPVMTDAQAFELTFTENYQREDLTPMEQGKAVGTLLAKFDNDMQAVASKMGKTIHWVATHAAIDKGLCADWKKAIVSGRFAAFTAAHLALIAPWPEETQKALMERFSYRGDRLTVADLQREMKEFRHDLSAAKWDITAELPTPAGAGKTRACAGCERNSALAPELWQDDGKKAGNGHCLDDTCWDARMKAALDAVVAKFKEENPDGVFVQANEYWKDDAAPGIKSLSMNEYDQVKKGDRGAVPALIVQGLGKGGVRWVKVDASAKEKAQKSAASTTGNSLADRRKVLESKRWAMTCVELDRVLAKTGYEGLQAHAYPASMVMALAEAFGTKHRYEYPMQEGKKWATVMAVQSPATGAEELWLQVRPVLQERIRNRFGITQVSDELIKEAKAVAQLIGVDLSVIFADVSTRKGFTEPKAWEALEAAEKASKDKSGKKASTAPAKKEK